MDFYEREKIRPIHLIFMYDFLVKDLKGIYISFTFKQNQYLLIEE